MGRLLALKRPNTALRSNSKIFKWNTNVFTPLQSSPKSAAETLTKLLANGKLRSTICHLRSMLAKRKQETTTASCSVSKLLGMKPLNNLMLSREKTRILLMKSRIFLTNLEMVADPFMSLTNNAEDWKLKRKSFKLLLKKQNLTILAKTTNAPWTLFKHHLKPNLVPSLRP